MTISEPQSRTASARRDMVGVIDIGSNSLRLVIYDRLSRAPVPLFNEKVMCALGRGLNRTARLNEAGVGLAHDNIVRFVALCRRLGVARLEALATSAVRDASDGPAFVDEVARRTGIEVAVIDGRREAQLAAAGVRAGIPDADGLTGDLGGGSLELAATGAQPRDDYVSLPIGPLRYVEEAGDDAGARSSIDAALDSVPFLNRYVGRPFYAVGGTWRALARIHMEQENYPLHIIQDYRIERGAADAFLSVLDRQSKRSLERMVGVSRRRIETIPLAAHVLQRLVRKLQPSSVVFSAYGLREGHLYAALDSEQQAEDPLIVAARQAALADQRFGMAGDELMRWTRPLFPGLAAADERLHHAAALLSDIGWQEHPDYRAEQVFMRAVRMPLPGLDHRGRVLIAVALHARYGGSAEQFPEPQVAFMLDPQERASARALGAAFRVGYALTGGAPSILAETGLSLGETSVTLTTARDGGLLPGEAVGRRLDALAKALGRRAVLAA